MPQISKIRIVNFRFNDGKRLIADELYDFEQEDRGVSDVLINLANGGGKSVLVQLMMQPIIPKAKVAGRRIESFFTKASDHCFVVTEWSLDTGKEKLLTGIAMAASDAASDTDQERGFQIKYYTFLSTYQKSNDAYSIVSLPLSKREQNRFVPASFEDIRNLAKRSGGALQRYASDDNPKWQEKLSQYGIIQNEWHMIETLNSNEDGLSEFFSTLKESDAVINKLILPRIEENQMRSASKDDSSLETMLISYAKQFAKQKDMILEQKTCMEFFDMLNKIKTEADELWKCSDDFETFLASLNAFASSLTTKIQEEEEKTTHLEYTKQQLQKTIEHIQWEKASNEFYSCLDAYEQETAHLETAISEKEEAQRNAAEATKKLQCIECANYETQRKNTENQIISISQEIQDRENNTPEVKHLASLKYSSFLAITKEQKYLAQQTETQRQAKNQADLKAKQIIADLNALTQSTENVKKKTAQAEALWQRQVDENDRMVSELGLRIWRMLDGRYRDGDVQACQKETMTTQQMLLVSIEQSQAKIKSLEERWDALPQEIANTKDAYKQRETIRNNLQNDLNAFKTLQQSIIHIY